MLIRCTRIFSKIHYIEHAMSNYDQQKWDARYAEPLDVPDSPSMLLTAHVDLLPTTGRALDVAGGAGRHAIWLAQRGWETTIVDGSSRGLAICRQRASEAGVKVTDICLDLEAEPLPAGPWDLIVSCCYLQRSLFPQMIAELAIDGMLIVCQPTRRNLERHDRPPAEYLLEEGELLQLVRPLEIVRFREGWLEEGRHDALVVACKV
jgi:SAM-dependent methyltransferase